MTHNTALRVGTKLRERAKLLRTYEFIPMKQATLCQVNVLGQRRASIGETDITGERW